MSHTSDAHLGLSEYLAGLIAELSEAVSHLEEADLKYRVNDISVEVDVAFAAGQSRERPNREHPAFWVLNRPSGESPRDQSSGEWNTQRLTVRLSQAVDEPEAETPEASAMPLLPPAHREDSD
jgi:hypothetical protein